MDADRDRRSYDRDASFHGETYRPSGGRSPPSRDDYRPRPPPVDTYVPSTSRAARPRSRSRERFRARSRSPGVPYRGRPRSPPPRRGYSPRRSDHRYDERQRSPPPRSYRAEERYSERSPRYARERSPVALKRSREASPVGSRGMRSPPPAKRERLASPRRGRYDDYPPRTDRRDYSPPRDTRRSPLPSRTYRPRSRSPGYRPERIEPYTVDDWRRRSPSPRTARERVSGGGSGATSRRSSPPVHPSRAAMQPDPEPYPSRNRSPYPPRSPPRRHDSSPPREYPPNGEGRAPAPYRNGEAPRGPPAPRTYGGAPPSGPSAGQVSMSAHNRPGSTSILSAPSHPRGGRGGYRGDYGSRDYPPRDFHSRDYPSGPPTPRRGSYGPSRGRGGAPPPYEGGLPSGPRGSYGGSHPFGGPPSFRGNNSTSTTYPRTQRFNTKPDPGAGRSNTEQYLSDLPAIVPGGQKLPDPVDMSKINRLEEEARKLKEMIAEKEVRARRAGADWDRLDRDSDMVGLKAELAEQHLRALNGEDESGGTGF